MLTIQLLENFEMTPGISFTMYIIVNSSFIDKSYWDQIFTCINVL